MKQSGQIRKFFTVEQTHNPRSDRVIGKNYADIPYETCIPHDMGSSFKNLEVPSFSLKKRSKLTQKYTLTRF